MDKHGLENQQALVALTVANLFKSKLAHGADTVECLQSLTLAVQQAPRYYPTIAETTKESSSVVDMGGQLQEQESSSNNISLPLVKLPSEKLQSTTTLFHNHERKTKTVTPTTSTSRPPQRVVDDDEIVVEASSTTTKKRLRADSICQVVTAKVEQATSSSSVDAARWWSPPPLHRGVNEPAASWKKWRVA